MSKQATLTPLPLSKTYTAKAVASKDPEEKGRFEAIVSVFGNKDSQGDIVEAGAFKKSLAEWTIKERPIPIVWAHQFGNIFNILGEYVSAEETDEGLKMVGQLELSWPEAQRVYELMEKGLVVEFSFSGQVRDYELLEEDDEDSWWPGLSIKDVDLWEAGPCFKGANAETQLLGIKSHGGLTGQIPAVLKEGRVLAQKHVDDITKARDTLNDVLAAVDKSKEDSEKTAKAGVTLSSEDESAPPAEENPHLTLATRALLDLIS